MTVIGESTAEGTHGVNRGGRGGAVFSMCLALLLAVAPTSALNLALPVAVSLAASTTSLTWIADAYTVTLVGLVHRP
ncbi:hypothetical protein [Streptomyces flavidovirens]|uniref:Uncharacterized protein n=1 Tax=Streptomyces flavidovirens TaxID=67298 RepID=A0ABW6RT37_9ACTN